MRNPTFRTALVPLVAAIIASTLHSFFPGIGGFFALLVGTMTIIGWMATVLVLIGVGAFRRRWKSAGLSLLILTCVSPVSLAVFALSGDFVHLLLLYPYYLSKIHQDGEIANEPVRFAWGDDAVSVLDGARLRVLIYDTSGEIASAMGQIKREDGLIVSTRHLIGNFYIENADTP
jgi:hypothetical protein